MTTAVPGVVDEDFVRAMPKAELHAHLSGSISPLTLQGLWNRKRAQGQCLDLEDPLTAIRQGEGFVDVVSFFPLFDQYIYSLVDDVWAVNYVTRQVLQDFKDDGVGYLELRTTPREKAASGMTKEAYVATVSEALQTWNEEQRLVHLEASETRHGGMIARLILCIDRNMSAEQAEEVVGLAIRYKSADITVLRDADECQTDENGDRPVVSLDRTDTAPREDCMVVGVDLCGNPMKGDVARYTATFRRAKAHGLGITVHFAEVAESSTDKELSTILSWAPDRLGHVIHVPPKYCEIIKDRKLALELCLSCNVITGLTKGGFAKHHIGRWGCSSDCAIAISTDDVGIFGSALSNEYLLVATHFKIPPTALIGLSKSAVRASFAGRKHMMHLIDRFEQCGMKNSQDAVKP